MALKIEIPKPELALFNQFRKEKGFSTEDAVTELIRAGLQHWVLVRENQQDYSSAFYGPDPELSVRRDM